MESRFLSYGEILCIPESDLPLIVLSRNYYSLFATEISVFDHSIWNHFMWMIHPGKLVTQNIFLQEVPISTYLEGKHNLKFWTCDRWRNINKLLLIRTIEECLAKPWYMRRYDVLQLVGIKLGIRKLHIPWMSICSDWADKILIMDNQFIGNHMTPGEVNTWCKNTEGYVEYGKFVPND